MGASAPVPHLWTRRLLRQFPEQARHRAFPCDASHPSSKATTRRKAEVVLRRRDVCRYADDDRAGRADQEVGVRETDVGREAGIYQACNVYVTQNPSNLNLTVGGILPSAVKGGAAGKRLDPIPSGPILGCAKSTTAFGPPRSILVRKCFDDSRDLIGLRHRQVERQALNFDCQIGAKGRSSE